MKKTILGAASAALMLATIGGAQANSAKSLSLSNARVSTAAGESNEAAGGFLIPLLAVAAVVLGVVVAVDGDDDADSN